MKKITISMLLTMISISLLGCGDKKPDTQGNNDDNKGNVSSIDYIEDDVVEVIPATYGEHFEYKIDGDVNNSTAFINATVLTPYNTSSENCFKMKNKIYTTEEIEQIGHRLFDDGKFEVVTMVQQRDLDTLISNRNDIEPFYKEHVEKVSNEIDSLFQSYAFETREIDDAIQNYDGSKVQVNDGTVRWFEGEIFGAEASYYCVLKGMINEVEYWITFSKNYNETHCDIALKKRFEDQAYPGSYMNWNGDVRGFPVYEDELDEYNNTSKKSAKEMEDELMITLRAMGLGDYTVSKVYTSRTNVTIIGQKKTNDYYFFFLTHNIKGWNMPMTEDALYNGEYIKVFMGDEGIIDLIVFNPAELVETDSVELAGFDKVKQVADERIQQKINSSKDYTKVELRGIELGLRKTNIDGMEYTYMPAWYFIKENETINDFTRSSYVTVDAVTGERIREY